VPGFGAGHDVKVVLVSSVPKATFRDPAGFVFASAGRIFRAVRPDAWEVLNAFLDSAACRKFLAEGSLVPSRETQNCSIAQEGLLAAGLRPDELQEWRIIEHDPVYFPSYPHEWPAEMLHAAGTLTLDLAMRSLSDGYGLKDATPFNILFQGPKPVFVDVLSFEPRVPGDPIWLPYSQFARTFLLPLAVEQVSLGSVQEVFLTGREGFDPETLYPRLSFLQRLQPPFLSLVSFPKWSNSKAQSSDSLYRPRLLSDPEQARFILKRLLGSLKRQLERVKPASNRASTWAGYEEERSHYGNPQLDVKTAFVDEVLRQWKPGAVLDVGANRGEFSILAARHGAKVVAIDLDPVVVGELWRRAFQQNLDILPLVVNLSRPSPALGWRNQESPSFLERSRGRFDAVMMLAVVHHLAVTERIPLDQILGQAAELTRQFLILEYVEPQDPMFRRLARGRDALYAHLTRDYFEECCRDRFEVLKRLPIEGTARTMYALRRLG